MIQQKRYALIIGGDRGPCQQARFGNWATLLNSSITGEAEMVFCSEPIMDPYILAHTAVVVLPRPYLPMHGGNVRRYGELKKKYGYDIVLDFDDIMWTVDGRSPMADYNPSPLDIGVSDGVVEGCLKWVDRVLCSTEFLAYTFCRRYGESWVNRVAVLPNYMFTSLSWNNHSRRKGPVQVWYGGSGCHFKNGMLGDFEGPWIPALSECIADGSISFHAFGESCGVLPEGTVLHGQVHSTTWLSTLSRYAPDIYIAPLCNNPFNKCKTALKALEACAVGAVLVASVFPGSPYSGFTPQLCSVSRETTPEELASLFRTLGDSSIRKVCLRTQRYAVEKAGLVAENRAGMDAFMRAIFGRFLEVHQ